MTQPAKKKPIKIKKAEETPLGLYVIFDKLAELHGPIFEAVNDAVAVRNYEKIGLDPKEFILKSIGMRIGDKIQISNRKIQIAKGNK